MMNRYIGLLLSLVYFCQAAHPEAQPRDIADLVLTNGKIITLDDAQPEAEAIAIKGDRILFVGARDQLDQWTNDETTVIDLRGQTAVPGLIEGHAHLLEIGRAKQILDLSTAGDWNEIVQRVETAARQSSPGTWIIGRGWHQEKWAQPPEPNIEGYPTHDALSRATPEHPVQLIHASGHMCIANANAMKLAGVTNRTADPIGGTILRTQEGEPAGVFRETAQSLIYTAIQNNSDRRSEEERRNELRQRLQLAMEECVSKGITSFHDAGASFETIDLYRSFAEQGQLKLRLYVMISEENRRLEADIDKYKIHRLGDHFLTVQAVKRLIDGALGAHGAWLLEPYSDMPESTGLNTTSIQSLRRTAQIAIEHGLQLCVHAIGDRANREVLDLYESIFRRHPAKTGPRWRVEHAQHIDPADMPRFAQLGVIASMQGIHCTSDAPFVIQRLGEIRAREGAYAWRSLLDHQVVVINGTDAPVEDVNPIRSFYASVTRKQPNGNPFFPEQRMTRMEALRSYTLDAAYAAFEEDIKGSLIVGKLADITVLTKDILTIPEEEILQTEVAMTMVGGRIVMKR